MSCIRVLLAGVVGVLVLRLLIWGIKVAWSKRTPGGLIVIASLLVMSLVPVAIYATITKNEGFGWDEMLCCLGSNPKCSTAVASWVAALGVFAVAFGNVLSSRRKEELALRSDSRNVRAVEDREYVMKEGLWLPK